MKPEMPYEEDLTPPRPASADRIAAVARAVAGVVPCAGQAIAELLTVCIPGQHQERLQDWCELVARNIEELKTDIRELQRPEATDLFEDGAREAVRALSPERRMRIAKLVAKGMDDIDHKYTETKRVLRLVGQLDDAEVVLLASYLATNQTGAFRERHAPLLELRDVHLKANGEDPDEVVVLDAGRRNLAQLGLVRIPQPIESLADTTLTPLGRLVLRRLDLTEEKDV